MTTKETIDLTKLRALLRTQHDEQIFYMLDDALEMLSPKDLDVLVRRYMPPSLLERIVGPRDTRSLLERVRAFDAAARAGEFYESFSVNSKNCTTHSKGTRGFSADCCRLFDQCADAVGTVDPKELRAAFDILLDLLRYIDEGHDNVIFFADEGGAWAVSVDWRRVMPAWFRCLSMTATPEEYASRIIEAVDDLEHASRDKHFAEAAHVGNVEQRAALLEHAR